MKTLRVGDILWCPYREEILEVLFFTEDELGQLAAILTRDGKKKLLYTAYLVFKRMKRLGRI